MAELRDFHGPNAAYVLDLYERWLLDPATVDEGWRSYFANFTPPAEAAAAPASPAAPATGAGAGADVEKALAAAELAHSVRGRGHTAARLNPLAEPQRPDPVLAPDFHRLTEADLAALPASVIRGSAPGSASAAAEIARLRQVYSGTVGYEFGHLPNPAEREWLREAVESGRYAQPLPPEHRRALLERLSQVEGFEKFLHRAFFGQKRFSIEGTDAMVPVLDEIISEAAGAGAAEVIIGMAHRGRLNVLTHVLGKPVVEVFEEFKKPAPRKEMATSSEAGGEFSGDVKYHL
ncbi:MAG TPA: hypothetical protein VNP72_00005, partial [Longimicrobium sp.]|nr:hypothetical protein [Longimicrobium sp.]